MNKKVNCLNCFLELDKNKFNLFCTTLANLAGNVLLVDESEQILATSIFEVLNLKNGCIAKFSTPSEATKVIKNFHTIVIFQEGVLDKVDATDKKIVDLSSLISAGEETLYEDLFKANLMCLGYFISNKKVLLETLSQIDALKFPKVSKEGQNVLLLEENLRVASNFCNLLKKRYDFKCTFKNKADMIKDRAITIPRNSRVLFEIGKNKRMDEIFTLTLFNNNVDCVLLPKIELDQISKNLAYVKFFLDSCHENWEG